MGKGIVVDALATRTAWLPRALLSGFAASAAMLLAFVLAFVGASLLGAVQLVDRPYAATLRGWFHGLTSNPLIDLARPNLYEAVAVFFMGGLVWAALYAAVVEPRLGGPHWQRGLMFSLLPWLFSLVVFLPLVGGGLFGLGLGAGPLPAIGNLVLHATYGVVLGQLYGPFGDRIVEGESGPTHAEDLRAASSSEAGAVRGLLGGLVLGVFVGVAISLATQDVTPRLPFNLNPAAVVVASSLIGASFGALIGSFWGLSQPEA